jgi:cell filamentation protein
VPDPYLLPNGTIRNKLGVRDAGELSKREDQITTVRQALLDKRGVRPPFNFDALKRIHWYLFQDVYDWAGTSRVCHIWKAAHDDPSGAPIMFTPHTRIEAEVARIFGALAADDDLCGLNKGAFAGAVANLFVEINNLHPFREGNGRTQRVFLRALAANAGHDLAFDVVTRERMAAVSVAGIQGDSEPAKRLFAEIIDPTRIGALRKALNFLKTSERVSWNDLYIATTVAGQEYRGLLVGRAGNDFMMRVSGEVKDWIAVGFTEDVPPGAKSGDLITIRTSKFK